MRRREFIAGLGGAAAVWGTWAHQRWTAGGVAAISAPSSADNELGVANFRLRLAILTLRPIPCHESIG
jgi:hypothetical protein